MFGFLILVTAISLLIARVYNKRTSATKAGLIVADRGLGKWEGAFSIAASWIWAPSLFVSAQKSFEDGLIGLFWFLVPNILCLIFFGIFAARVREEKPDGFTLSDYIFKKTSKRVQTLYWITLTGLVVCAFAVQLLAGGQLFSKVTGLSYFQSTFILCLIPLSYSLFSGLKTTVITDILKMIFVYGIGFIIVPWAVYANGGLPSVIAGLGGKINDLNFFGAQSSRIFLTFGLPVTIGLLAGPFGDQTFWQRTFAIQKKDIKTAYFNGAFLFAIVPILMSFLGFIAAGSGLAITNPQMVNLEVVSKSLSTFATWLFVFMVLAALISILDTKLTGIASLAAHDFANRIFKTENANYNQVKLTSRISMVFLAMIALLISNIPNLKILHLFLFYGTLRSATVIPTIFFILGKKLNEKSVFWGIIISLVLGLPIFSYGNINQDPTLIVIGSLLTVGCSGLIAWSFSRTSSSSKLMTD